MARMPNRANLMDEIRSNKIQLKHVKTNEKGGVNIDMSAMDNNDRDDFASAMRRKIAMRKKALNKYKDSDEESDWIFSVFLLWMLELTGPYLYAVQTIQYSWPVLLETYEYLTLTFFILSSCDYQKYPLILSLLIIAPVPNYNFFKSF